MLARLLIRPDQATITVDERAELAVLVQAEYGQAFPMPTVEWSANGGTVMAESVFSAEETRKTPYSRLAYARGLGGMDSGVLRVRRQPMLSPRPRSASPKAGTLSGHRTSSRILRWGRGWPQLVEVEVWQLTIFSSEVVVDGCPEASFNTISFVVPIKRLDAMQFYLEVEI